MTDKPKVLIIPGYKLFPFETGAGLAQYNFIDALRKRVQLSVLLSPVNVNVQDQTVLEGIWPNVKFHYWSNIQIKPVMPTIGQRIVNKLSALVGADKEDISIERSQKYEQIHYNIENILLPPPEWMKLGLQNLLMKYEFDLVQFDLPINMGLAPIVRGQAKTLFVHHEVKFQRVATSLTGAEDDIEELQALYHRVKLEELRQLEVFDAIQVFSEEDKLLLTNELKTPIFACPFALSDDQFKEGLNNESLERLIFIGSDQHEPNMDALKWFIEDWISDFPSEFNLPIHILGKWSEKNILRFSNKNIHFEGFVSSLEPWMRNSALIAPIRVGAGLRTKIMEAMAMSMPVIATKFATQGLGVTKNEILFAESGSECWDKIKLISESNETFHLFQKQAFIHANNFFSISNNIDKRTQIIDKTLTTPDE